MNKNVIVVGAIAAGLYLLSLANKPKKLAVKKKAPHIKPKSRKPVIKKKKVYNKPKIKKAVSKKKVALKQTKPKKKSKIKYHIAV